MASEVNPQYDQTALLKTLTNDLEPSSSINKTLQIILPLLEQNKIDNDKLETFYSSLYNLSFRTIVLDIDKDTLDKCYQTAFKLRQAKTEAMGKVESDKKEKPDRKKENEEFRELVKTKKNPWDMTSTGAEDKIRTSIEKAIDTILARQGLSKEEQAEDIEILRNLDARARAQPHSGYIRRSQPGAQERILKAYPNIKLFTQEEIIALKQTL